MEMKPYPAYADTDLPWLPKIPKHWEIKKLKYLKAKKRFAIVDGPFGTQLGTPDYKTEGIPLIRVGNLDYFGKLSLEDVVFISEEKWRELQRSAIEPGDIVIAKTGATIGKSGIVPKTLYKGLIASSCIKISPNHEILLSEFLTHVINTDDFQKQILDASGGSTRDTINITPFSNLEIVIPPLPEQQAIAAYLDRQTAKIDTLIAKKQRLLNLLAEQRAVLISQAVTKGLNPAVKMKDSGVAWLGQVPGHWEITKIKFLGKIGNGSTPLRDNLSYWENGSFPWLTSTVVNNDIVGKPSNFVSEVAMRECHLPIVQPNSILVAITGEGKTRGKASLLPYQATINQHLAFIHLQKEFVKPEYLQLFLTCSYENLRMISEGSGSTKGALTCEQLGEYKILLPSIHEQESIISYVLEKRAKIDLLVQATSTTITRLQEYRAALISSVVTGKVQVK